MSNGTRIDPEEREPRAIKIRKPKNKRRKIVLSVLSSLLVFALCGGIFAFIEYGPEITVPGTGKVTESSASEQEEPTVPSEPEIPEEPESVPEVPEEPQTPIVEEPIIEEDPIPRDEWFMILVNAKNPLPEDFAVETVAIDDENHTVDSRIAEDLSAMISAGES